MQQPMARFQFRSSSFLDVLKFFFEDWLIEKKRIMEEKHNLIDSRPRKL